MPVSKSTALIMKRQVTKNTDPKGNTNKAYNSTTSSGMRSPTRMTSNINQNATGGKPPIKSGGNKASALAAFRRSSDSAIPKLHAAKQQQSKKASTPKGSFKI